MPHKQYSEKHSLKNFLPPAYPVLIFCRLVFYDYMNL